MSSQAWALIGVAVGSILGGLAQVVAVGARSRFERQQHLRQRREDGYVDLLTKAKTLQDKVWNFSIAAVYRPEEDPEEKESLAAMKDMFDAHADLLKCVQEIGVFGSGRVYKLAEPLPGLILAHFDSTAGRTEGSKLGALMAELSDKIEDLRLAAREDLRVD